MDKAALQALLVARRASTDPADYGFSRTARQGRRAKGLSQDQMDQLLDRATGTYARIEGGRYRKPPEDILRQIACILRMSEQEWVALWRFASCCDPPRPLDPQSGHEVPAIWQDAVDSIRAIAYITDSSWRIVAHNEACSDLFGGRVPANIMRWMLLEPEGRLTLTDWEQSWAPRVAPQLRAGIAALPCDETLRQIVADVLADPQAGPIYKAVGDAHIHPDGSTRPIRHATLGPGWISLCAAGPLSSPHARMIIGIYHPGPERPDTTRPPLRAR